MKSLKYFCWILVWIFKIQHSKPNMKVCLPRVVWIQQKISTEFLARVSWSSCLVYVLPNNLSVNLLSDRRFLPDTRRDIHCDTHRDTRYDGRNLWTFSYINSQTEVFIWVISLIASIVQEQLLPVFFSFCLLYYFYIWIQQSAKLCLTLASNLFIFNFCDFTCLHFQIEL